MSGMVSVGEGAGSPSREKFGPASRVICVSR